MFDKIDISAADIRHKEFKTSAFGYNKDEIRDYLDLLAEHFEVLYAMLREQSEKQVEESTEVTNHQETILEDEELIIEDDILEEEPEVEIASPVVPTITLEEIQKREELIAKTLIHAETTRSVIIENAKKEAENIIREAEMLAKRAIDETKHFLSLMKN